MGGNRGGGRSRKAMGWGERRNAYRNQEMKSSIRRARLQVTIKERGATCEAEMVGNRKLYLGSGGKLLWPCGIDPRAAAPPANHCHLYEYFCGTEKGSVALIVWCREDGSP